MVRLGEHDLRSVDDGLVQDINVIDVVEHPEYLRYDTYSVNDIAIVYLETDASFSCKIFILLKLFR